MSVKLSVPLLVLAIGCITIAQQTSSSSSQTQSQNGSARATSSSSSSSSAQAGGAQGASARSSQSGSQNANGSASAGKFKVTRPTHVIVYSPNPVGAGNSAVGIGNSIWQDQKAYFELLGKQGKLLYAGPWRDSNGALLIVNCESDQDAQNIADEDPVVKSLIYVANVKAWNVNYIGPFVVAPEKSQGGQTSAGGK